MGKLLNLITGGNKTGGTNGTTHFSKVVCKDCHTEYAIPISARRSFIFRIPSWLCRNFVENERIASVPSKRIISPHCTSPIEPFCRISSIFFGAKRY